MKPLRVVLVTRRFWPLIGGGERMMANLAEVFREQQIEPTVVTAQWERSWPQNRSIGLRKSMMR